MADLIEKNVVNDTLNTIFDGVDSFVCTKKVIGEPYTIGDTTIIPFIETDMGMAVGAFNKDKEAGGMSCKIKPIACLIIQNGFTKLISISDQDAITKAIDLIPDLVDKIFKRPNVSEEVKKSVKNMKPKIES